MQKEAILVINAVISRLYLSNKRMKVYLLTHHFVDKDVQMSFITKYTNN